MSFVPALAAAADAGGRMSGRGMRGGASGRVLVCGVFVVLLAGGFLPAAAANSPRSTVTACPPRYTRSSPRRTRTIPPRAEA